MLIDNCEIEFNNNSLMIKGGMLENCNKSELCILLEDVITKLWSNDYLVRVENRSLTKREVTEYFRSVFEKNKIYLILFLDNDGDILYSVNCDNSNEVAELASQLSECYF